MKKMRKMIALMIAMVMVIGTMSMTAFATSAEAPKGSIEITSPVTDPNAANTTYEAYKIFDMTTDGTTDDNGDYSAVAYTINPAWTGFFATGAPGAAYISATDTGNLNRIVIDGVTKYINITDSNVQDFATDAFEYAQKTPVAATTSKSVAQGATEVKFEGLELGYYMVYPKGASINLGTYTSIVSISNTSPNGQIEQKAKWPGLKKVADDISVEVGQKVTYTLTSNVPNTSGFNKKYEMDFSDKTSAGLTFDGADSITVTIGGTPLTKGTDYTVDTTTADFKVTIDMLTGEENNKTAKYTYNDEIKVTYTATVNENAVTKIDENTAELAYNNDPKNTESKDKTPPVVVKVYSSKLVIEKVDAKNKTKKLAGAKFVLRAKTVGSATGDSHETDLAAGKYYYYDTAAKDVKWVTPTSEKPEDLAKDTTITVVTTDANGEAKFDGLEDGVYELIEVEAPAGYNLLTAPTEATIAGSDSDVTKLTVTAEVGNNSGTQLPSTGGIGTTLFYVVGSILVIGAAVLLISKRRMSNR